MPRLATEGKKMGEARREVEEEASQAQSDRAKPKKERRRGGRRGGNDTGRRKRRRGEEEGTSRIGYPYWPHQGEGVQETQEEE